MSTISVMLMVMSRSSPQNQLSEQVDKVRQFNRFYTRIIGLLEETFLGSPLTLSEARLIFEISGHSTCRASDLARLLTMDRGHLSRLLLRLEDKGLIGRDINRHDKRARDISLTLAGKALLERLEGRSSHQIKGLLQPLSPKERNQIIEAMSVIRSLLGGPEGER